MCLLCLQDFVFELPVKPDLEQKKKRLLKVKSLLSFASQLALVDHVCQPVVEALKDEQYELSREF